MTTTDSRTGVRVVTDWAVAYGCPSGDPNESAGVLEYDDEAEAAEMLQWLPESILARRTLIVGPWERAEGDAPGNADLMLIFAALDEAAEDRAERAKPSGCPECAVLVPGVFCPEHQQHLVRASQYRDLRDRLEAGR